MWQSIEGWDIPGTARRDENRSTLMTSNRSIENWSKLIGDVPSVTAILDRFLPQAIVIPITP
jgi:DNA replication protein DnaC